MNIFHKTTQEEYNNELEKILENKVFDTESKNLLLSMVYKIENAYKDYYKVKPISVSKEEFISRILNIIENECDMIEIIAPETKKAKALKGVKKNFEIDVKQGKITILGNEKDMLTALIQLDEEYNYYKYKDIPELAKIHNFIKIGEAMDVSEVIRDFNGWSWNTVIKEIEDISTNIAYQSILILLDRNIKLCIYNYIKKELEKNENPEQIKISIEEVLKSKYKIEEIDKFLNYINIIIEKVNIEEDENKKNKIKNEFSYNKKMVTLMENKIVLLEDITSQKKLLAKKIKEIDKILNNENLLEEEYQLRNSKLKKENKIFSVNHLKTMLKEERKNILERIKSLNNILDPKKYLKEQERVKNNYEECKRILQLVEGKDLEDILINLEIEFLKCFNKKIELCNRKDELKNLIMQFRYFCQLPINEMQQVKDIKEIEEILNTTMNNLIDKCIEKKIIINISDSISLCYNILKNVFFSRIIELEKISLKITKVKNKDKGKNKEKIDTIDISLYCEGEEEERKRETVNNLKLLNIKLNRKTPLFF